MSDNETAFQEINRLNKEFNLGITDEEMKGLFEYLITLKDWFCLKKEKEGGIFCTETRILIMLLVLNWT